MHLPVPPAIIATFFAVTVSEGHFLSGRILKTPNKIRMLQVYMRLYIYYKHLFLILHCSYHNYIYISVNHADKSKIVCRMKVLIFTHSKANNLAYTLRNKRNVK